MSSTAVSHASYTQKVLNSIAFAGERTGWFLGGACKLVTKLVPDSVSEKVRFVSDKFRDNIPVEVKAGYADLCQMVRWDVKVIFAPHADFASAVEKKGEGVTSSTGESEGGETVKASQKMIEDLHYAAKRVAIVAVASIFINVCAVCMWMKG